MPLSTIDFELVPTSLLSMLAMLNSVDSAVGDPNVSNVEGIALFLAAIDAFRNNVALEVELQGKRK
jgi:hypothetical protein